MSDSESEGITPEAAAAATVSPESVETEDYSNNSVMEAIHDLTRKVEEVLDRVTTAPPVADAEQSAPDPTPIKPPWTHRKVHLPGRHDEMDG
jgi:hypothetical protein